MVQSRLSRDTLHLVEPRAAGAERDVDVYRITSIADGTTYDLASPISPIGPPGQTDDLRSIVGDMAVVPAPDGGRTVLLTRGRSVVTLHAERTAGDSLSYDPTVSVLTRDGRFVVAGNDSQATVLDRAAGAPWLELVFSSLPDTRVDSISVVDGLNLLTVTSDRWVYREFDVPSLVARVHAELPHLAGTPPEEQAKVAATDERISGLTAGVLATWERATGEPTGKPILLGDTPERALMFRDKLEFDVRPVPVPQVAVVGDLGEVELWNPVTGTMDGVLQTPRARAPVQLAFDHTGTRLITLDLDVAIEVWDVDRRQPLGGPIPIGTLPVIRGITADGQVVLVQAASSPDTYQLTFWDIGSGRQTGSVRLSAAHDAGNDLDGGENIRINGQNGAMPFFFPVTAAGWVKQLCRFTARPFTTEERSLMPAGVDVESPCPA